MPPPAGFAIYTYNPALVAMEMKPVKHIYSPPGQRQHTHHTIQTQSSLHGCLLRAINVSEAQNTHRL